MDAPNAVLKDLEPQVAQVFADGSLRHVAVAVSGGGDSLALLHIMARLCAARDIRLSAVTVDHGLRAEAALEIAHVADLCSGWAVAHHVVHWAWDGHGNLQQAARDGRYLAMAEWARAQDVDLIALGHTQDDVAENLLLRLGREAGVDGLARMAARFTRHGANWARPLLDVSRESLRAHLQASEITWKEDPSNADPRFARVRARSALASLQEAGIPAASLAEVSKQLTQTAQYLQAQTAQAACDTVQFEHGRIQLKARVFFDLPKEIQRRLMAALLRYHPGQTHGPRRGALAALLTGLEAQDPATTLAGCRVERRRETIEITREPRAVAPPCTMDQVWDRRWQLRHPDAPKGAMVGALGADGLQTCPNWRETGLTRHVLLVSPAVWMGPQCLAAPLAGRAEGWQALPTQSLKQFNSMIKTH